MQDMAIIMHEYNYTYMYTGIPTHKHTRVPTVLTPGHDN